MLSQLGLPIRHPHHPKYIQRRIFIKTVWYILFSIFWYFFHFSQIFWNSVLGVGVSAKGWKLELSCPKRLKEGPNQEVRAWLLSRIRNKRESVALIRMEWRAEQGAGGGGGGGGRVGSQCQQWLPILCPALAVHSTLYPRTVTIYSIVVTTVLTWGGEGGC